MPENNKPSEANLKSGAKAARDAAKQAVDTTQGFAGSMEGVPVTANISAAQDETLHTMEVAGTAIVEGLSKAQKEISDFVSERIRQDIEAQSEFMRCRTFDDVREVQSKFLKTAMDQYSAEASRLMQISADLMALSLPRSPR
jgi:Phasin protein